MDLTNFMRFFPDLTDLTNFKQFCPILSILDQFHAILSNLSNFVDVSLFYVNEFDNLTSFYLRFIFDEVHVWYLCKCCYDFITFTTPISLRTHAFIARHYHEF